MAADGRDGAAPAAGRTMRAVPYQLDDGQRSAYRSVFAAIRTGRWADAELQLDAMRRGPLHSIARAELYTAKGSPKIELLPLQALLAEAPELPHASDIARLAKLRGAEELPELPVANRLTWHDGAPNRIRLKSVKSDAAAAELATRMEPIIKDDLGAAGEALVADYADRLSPEALTEWQQRVAWIYYLSGNDAAARRIAAQAQRGSGEWVPQADWVQGLAAWRMRDYAGAQAAFTAVAQRATDVDLRAAGLYWASRADIAAARPDLVQARLQNAAQYNETFYGMLARQALGVSQATDRVPTQAAGADWKLLERRPNVRVAAALMEIDEDVLAANVIRHQARIGAPDEYAALARVAGAIDLPATQLWLSHNIPAGARPMMEARYPAPSWTPDGGWRVDKALVYAHALQESRFQQGVVSPAGAYGLMQIMPAAATDIGRQKGIVIDRSALSRPSTNIEVGQSYLEKLRDMPTTGGLLPKVIAAYNAGPSPVAAWNLNPRDGGDPLLYIESIPYWETRGYVMTVLRNYWMYEAKEGKVSASRDALSQGLWPRFPGMKGDTAVNARKGGRGAQLSAR
ncbi:lytic transglycosylase domain-containing protein [Sphingomonas baiyangensis]|uniref:Lytic transglycosylase domain-containing protein n=1 Tax=Sphingomonas baiyangensis TaxID=2572576 RepID=A0A4U1L7J5_9SPHN|nr:lytic transglycosylase domain-containing protein [Sphingomonas baiyangensis]TKD52216.1 lytic transglycosylase domain-containing protein [Sphingomonas baiyangensis]